MELPKNPEELKTLISAIQAHLNVLTDILKLTPEEQSKIFIKKPEAISQNERSRKYYQKNKDKICEKVREKRKKSNNVSENGDDNSSDDFQAEKVISV